MTSLPWWLPRERPTADLCERLEAVLVISNDDEIPLSNPAWVVIAGTGQIADVALVTPADFKDVLQL